MNKQEQLHFPQDFKEACEIFEMDPLDVLQQFMDSVSLPKFFSNPFDPDRWANTFMLECVLAHIKDYTILERYDRFLNRITERIPKEMDNNKEEVCRQIMQEWHRAVLEGRIKDVMGDES